LIRTRIRRIMVLVPEKLASLLRRHRTNALIAEAEIIRDFRDGDERTCQAENYIREAMYQQVIGNITAEERCRIFSILHFAMPKHAPTSDDLHPTFDAHC
jgi:hypothetical protein